MFSKKQINGLLFSSSEERINDRTSLILFDDSPLKLKDAFRIDFDLAIWDIKQFGYILRIINENKQEINFSFVNFYGEDKIYLDFHSPITHESVQIPFSVQDIEEKRWLPISIIFDLKKDRAEVVSKDSSYICKSIGLQNPSRIKLAFGLYGLNLDVPQMAIRDIRIGEVGGRIHNVPLDGLRNEIVHDDNGKVRGISKNPKWLVYKHYYWEEKAVFESDPTTGIAYDSSRNNVIVVDKDAIFSYSMRYDNERKVLIKDFPFALNSGEAIYDDKTNLLYVYNLEQKTPDSPTMAIINMVNNKIEYKHASMSHRLYHHNAFMGTEKKGFYIFGGYGNHSYSNKILKYNIQTDSWEQVDFTGDEIYSRYFSASGQGKEPSQILIMGGIGNESGKQEHGGRHLSDLFSLDIETKQVKKIWDIKDVHSGFVPCSNLILSEDSTHFFTLCYPQHEVNSTLQLYKFRLSDGSYEVVSDTIHINAEQMETSVYLFYNKQLKEFYTVIRENNVDRKAKILIYSLLSPPVNFSELKSEENQSIFYWVLFSSLFLIIAISAIVLLLRKKRRRTELLALLEKNYQEEKKSQSKKEVDKKNAIFIFGNFAVYDKNNREISYRFSSKLKSLFALILFYSIEDDGVSTDMMSFSLWPDKDLNGAKNTRGVTINRLRNILADISGITLFHQNSKWYFSFDSDFYCDYLEYRKSIKNIKKEMIDEDECMSNLSDIINRGPFFQNIQEDWIDSYKHEYESEIENILWNYIVKLNESKKYVKVIEYSELYFIIDSLNEDVLRLCIHAMQKIGKKEQAITLYNKFVANYKKLMGEDPILSQPM